MDEQALYRLMSWLTPENFFAGQACSQSLEFAVEAGLVRDAASLAGWIIALLSNGAGHVDAVLFHAAYNVAAVQNAEAFAEIAQIAASLLAGMGVACASAAMGATFLASVRQSWPDPGLEQVLRYWEGPIVHPVAVAAACGARPAPCRIPLNPALTAYLRAYVGYFVSAGRTLLPLSPAEAEAVTAKLEQPTLEAVHKALRTDLSVFDQAVPQFDPAPRPHAEPDRRIVRA
ncbi:MAG: hypothetical protein GVY13_07270 [Alphaproteobacteria bacterium]|jgi:urease accessory protein|nr:hypothetical protein [Alphaproteobacteria bacterium]